MESKSAMKEYGIENLYRRFPRVPFASRIILHDQHKGYFCNSVDISEKGISIKLDEKLPFQPSQEITITVRDFPELGTFSLRTVVLREFNDQDAKLLGFYFLHLNPNIRRCIAQYVRSELKNLNQEEQAV